MKTNTQSSSNNKSNLRQRSNLSETVKKGSVQSIVSASGTVQTANYLPVTTSVNGIVKKVYVKEGQTVLKGQKIMDLTLDSEGQNSMTSSYASYLRSKIDLQAAKNSILAAESNILQKNNSCNSYRFINRLFTQYRNLSIIHLIG